MKCQKIKFLSSLIAVLMLACFALSGCNVMDVFDGGVEEIMQPPVYDTEKYNINLALNNVVKGSVTLKFPKEGRFVTACTEYDLDGDEENEAIVFYQEKIRDKDGDKITLYIHLFRKDDGEWVSAQRIKSEDTGVYSLEFCDLNKDGVQEIIVMWERASIKNTKTLAIYEYNEGNLEYGEEKVCEVAATIDLIQNNNRVEIVTFGFNDENSNSVAEAYVYSNKVLVPQGNGAVELGDEIIGYAEVSPSSEQYINGKKYYARVVVDSYYRNYQTLFTQFVYWNNNSLMVSKLDGELEKRTVDVTSRDINYDGVVEFPSIRSVKSVARYGIVNDDSPYYVVSWMSDYEISNWPTELWSNTVCTISVSDFDFTLKIPQEWWENSENIAIEKDEDSNKYVIYRLDSRGKRAVESYISIRIFKISEWENNDSAWKDDKDILGDSLKYTRIQTNKAETLVYALGSTSGELPDGVELLINE